jgi:hypothetical protein
MDGQVGLNIRGRVLSSRTSDENVRCVDVVGVIVIVIWKSVVVDLV